MLGKQVVPPHILSLCVAMKFAAGHSPKTSTNQKIGVAPLHVGNRTTDGKAGTTNKSMAAAVMAGDSFLLPCFCVQILAATSP